MTTLRLADAIRLGSTLMTCGYDGGLDPIGSRTVGCGLEMALVAVGRTDLCWVEVDNVWPWTDAKKIVIACRFDDEFVLSSESSIDAFAAWVDSIDPTPRIEPPVQEPSQVEVRQESTVSHG